MNIALGFGSTESEFEAAEEAAFVAYVSEQYRAQSLSYFSDEFIDQVTAWVNDRSKATQVAANRFRKAEDYPDRYSSYWATVAQSVCDLVLIARFSHINRRHALSPDGWAMMTNTRLFHISSIDIPKDA